MTQNKSENLYSKFQVGAFVKAQHIQADAIQITSLLTKLKTFNLLPNTVQEQTPNGIINRLSFVTPDNKLQVILASNRFDVVFSSGTPSNDNLGSFSEFCQRGCKILSTLLKHYKLKSNRLAAITEKSIDIDTGDNKKLNKVVNSLFILPKFYQNQEYSEFDWRMVARRNEEVGNLKEDINLITSIKRGQSFILEITPQGVKPLSNSYDKFQITFDINTIPIKQDERFDENNLKGFFDCAINLQKQLESDFNDVLGN